MNKDYLNRQSDDDMQESEQEKTTTGRSDRKYNQTGRRLTKEKLPYFQLSNKNIIPNLHLLTTLYSTSVIENKLVTIYFQQHNSFL